MKKITIVILLFALAHTMSAETFEVITKDGKTYHGEFVSKTDSTLTILDKYTLNHICIFGNMIVSARSREGGEYYMSGGKLTGMSKTEFNAQYMAQKQKVKQEHTSDPNYVIGKALKSTGTGALFIGAPSLFVGTILVGVGYGKLNTYNKMTKDIAAGREVDKNKYSKLSKDIAQHGETYTNCATAGCVLMPFGGALTIIGAPLVAHGKKVMEFSVQVSENGPGVTVNF